MIMWAPTSTHALARRLCQSSSPTRGLFPAVWLQKSMRVVVPPNAAAFVPVSTVSTVCVGPNSQSRWVCTSTPLGKTSRPLASCPLASAPAAAPAVHWLHPAHGTAGRDQNGDVLPRREPHEFRQPRRTVAASEALDDQARNAALDGGLKAAQVDSEGEPEDLYAFFETI